MKDMFVNDMVTLIVSEMPPRDVMWPHRSLSLQVKKKACFLGAGHQAITWTIVDLLLLTWVQFYIIRRNAEPIYHSNLKRQPYRSGFSE